MRVDERTIISEKDRDAGSLSDWQDDPRSANFRYSELAGPVHESPRLRASGQLGTDVVQRVQGAARVSASDGARARRLDGSSRSSVAVARERPDAVVNCAAFHDPAGCEENPELAFAVNAAAVETSLSLRRDLGEAHDREHRLRLRWHEGRRLPRGRCAESAQPATARASSKESNSLEQRTSRHSSFGRRACSALPGRGARAVTSSIS